MSAITKKVALLVVEGATASSVTASLDMFRIARRFQSDIELKLFSPRGGLVRLTDAVAVDTQRLPASLAGYAAVILPGFFADSMEQLDAQLQGVWRTTIRRLKALPADTLVAASCYGTFVLAEAGLLDEQPATTTWWMGQVFSQRYPRVKLQAEQALVDGGRALTGGAMTAHTDLSLQVLRRLGGAALARQVGGIMLVDGARSSQKPFMSLPMDFNEPLVSQALDWMNRHLAEPLSMDELAATLHVSYRTLNRRFLAITGLGPLAYLQALRVERAKELLESSRRDFDTITAEVGYNDGASFRRLFKRATGLSPAQYRRQFKVG